MRSLSIGVFNAHWGVGTGRAHRARYDVAAVLRSLDADVLVLPETWCPHAGPSVLDALRADGYTTEVVRFTTLKLGPPRPYVEEPGDGWWCLAVASRLPARLVGRIPLRRLRNDQVPLRHAIHVAVDVGGTALDVIGLHVSSRVWKGAPAFQLRALRPHLPEAGVVAGDCNLWGPMVELLLPGWRRVVRGRTWPAHRPHSQIDHVLTRGPIAASTPGEVRAGGLSDHRAIRVALQVGP